MRLAAVILFFVLALHPAASRAETRAVLIGVSKYDESIGLSSLRGPAHDVTLMQAALAARGVSDIVVLADGVEGGGVPSKAAILTAFATLADQSRAGDLVFIHMSGHGTRQPDRNGDETDGLDEVFLPADVARAEPGTNAIPNALIDDEIGAAVLAIRRTGADVWLTMDSCHSGSGLRAGSTDTADRFADPATLGVSDAAAEGGGGIGAFDDTPDDAPGKVVAFYAARSSEVAREVNLTPDIPGDDGWYGLFSSRLAARLSQSEGMSYRQLFQAVLGDMNDGSVPGGARVQTPSWEGGLIDAAVLGGRDTVGIRQFAVNGDEVAAGLVQGLGNGTLLALVADAAASADAVLGYAQMEDAAATFAYLRAVDAGCEPRSDVLCPTIGALPPGARFARIVAKPLDLVLRLAPPRELATGEVLTPEAPAALALAAAMAEVNAEGLAHIETDPETYDIEVALADGALWFGHRVAAGTTPVGLPWREGDDTPLAAILKRIAQAEQLAAMLGSVEGSGSLLNPSPVAIKADVLTTRVADLDPPGAQSNPARECRRALGSQAEDAATPLDAAAELKQCDALTFAVRGEVRGARDVNRIHIDSHFCIHAAHAHVEDDAAPILLGDQMVMCSDCPDGYAAGDEQLFVVVTESRDNADQLNLEGLVENCGAEDAAPTRGAEGRRASEFLMSLGRRPDTRGAFGGLDIADVWVKSYRWQVLPKDVVFGRVRPDSLATDDAAISKPITP